MDVWVPVILLVIVMLAVWDVVEVIEGVIERLNFKPNVLAQNLKTGSSRTIGVLTQSLVSGYFADAMAGIDDALAILRQGPAYHDEAARPASACGAPPSRRRRRAARRARR